MRPSRRWRASQPLVRAAGPEGRQNRLTLLWELALFGGRRRCARVAVGTALLSGPRPYGSSFHSVLFQRGASLRCEASPCGPSLAWKHSPACRVHSHCGGPVPCSMCASSQGAVGKASTAGTAWDACLGVGEAPRGEGVFPETSPYSTRLRAFARSYPFSTWVRGITGCGPGGVTGCGGCYKTRFLFLTSHIVFLTSHISCYRPSVGHDRCPSENRIKIDSTSPVIARPSA